MQLIEYLVIENKTQNKTVLERSVLHLDSLYSLWFLRLSVDMYTSRKSEYYLCSLFVEISTRSFEEMRIFPRVIYNFQCFAVDHCVCISNIDQAN